jgi:hypothetical protein
MVLSNSYCLSELELNEPGKGFEFIDAIKVECPAAIVGFYLSYDPEIEITNEDEPYELWVTVVFDHAIHRADEIADEVTDKIFRRLQTKFKTAHGWKSIEFRNYESCSDLDFSLYDAQTMKLYRLEHINLKYSARASPEIRSNI